MNKNAAIQKGKRLAKQTRETWVLWECQERNDFEAAHIDYDMNAQSSSKWTKTGTIFNH